jgi:hypothetical protein
MDWIEYSYEQKETRPPKHGKYLVYNAACDKIYTCTWNGSGWADGSTNKGCTYYMILKKPTA